MKKYIVLALLVTGLTFSQDLLAENPQNKLSGSLSNTVSSGVNRNHKNVYNDFDVTGSYAWTKHIQTSLTAGFVKSFTQLRQLLAKDIILNTSHSNIFTHAETGLKFSGYSRFFLPTSKTSQNNSRILAFKSGLRLNSDVQSWLLGYELSGSYFAHRYVTAKDGSSNKHYGMTHTATIGYQVTKDFSVNTIWSLLNFATYNKTPKASYSFVQEINYAVNPMLDLSAGLSTGGRQYKNNGEELNLSVFDVDGTEVYFGGNISF